MRVDVDKNGDKAAWYVFHLGEISAGAFGNWRTDLNEKWCSHDRRQLTDAQSAEYASMVAEAKRQREALKAELQAAAKVRANEIWNTAVPVIAHPYLAKKQVPAHGLRQSKNKLIVPLKDEHGDIHNLQFIAPQKGEDGKDKKFLFGGRVEGLSFTILGGNSLEICEGFATGASIHQAIGGTVICAFNAGNLLPVAKAVRLKCPHDKITIFADNDRFTAGNTGITKANEAAKAVGARVVFPVFDGLPGADDPELKLSDFNDLAAVGGIDLVKQQILSWSSPAKNQIQPLEPASTKVDNWLKKRPKPTEFIFKLNDQGLIPRGVVGVLAAESGCGKTFFLLSLAMAGADGGNFGPINAPKKLSTLIVLCEDDQEMMGRRLWDIGKGKFPEKLHAASVYGQIGPLMRLDGNNPVLADMWYWLDETIERHNGLDLLIIDPKSRFYGLDENNNDHATQWITALERLSKKHGITIIFSSHTSKGNAKEITQGMVRGGGGIVDGCRWQAGMIRMDEETAKRFCIDNPREYVLFDAPKSNYAADLPSAICFKRGEGGVLEYCEPRCEIRDKMGEALVDLLSNDPVSYSRTDLVRLPLGRGVASDMKDRFPGFTRSKDMDKVIDRMIQQGKLFEKQELDGSNSRPKTTISTSPF